jgi:cell division protein FtsQ
MGVVAVFLLIASLVYYGLNNWFQINRIIISGNVPNLNKDYVSRLVRNNLTGTYFTLNIRTIKEEFEKVPWVKSVYVEREFPDTIRVNIEEYEPIVNLGNGRLLSKEKLIFGGDDLDNKLPVFTINESQIDNALLAYEQIKPFMALHNLQLKSLWYNGVGLTKMKFSNSLEITLCGNSISNSLDTLNKYWNQVPQIESKVTTVNMCYKNAFAIN